MKKVLFFINVQFHFISFMSKCKFFLFFFKPKKISIMLNIYGWMSHFISQNVKEKVKKTHTRKQKSKLSIWNYHPTNKQTKWKHLIILETWRRNYHFHVNRLLVNSIHIWFDFKCDMGACYLNSQNERNNRLTMLLLLLMIRKKIGQNDKTNKIKLASSSVIKLSKKKKNRSDSQKKIRLFFWL